MDLKTLKKLVHEATMSAVKPHELHVSDAGGGKYKVHAVGKNFASGIKAGEHLSDTELDDFSDMGGKIKMVKSPKPMKEDSELDEETPTKQQVKQAIGIARDKRYAQGNVTGAVKAMDKLNKGLAQHPAVKKELQKQNEDVELDEISDVAHAKYRLAARADIRTQSKNLDVDNKAGDRIQKRVDGLARSTGLERVKKMTKEEVEQVDELSKSTLASYAKKSSNDARVSGQIAKDFENKSSSYRKPQMKAGAARLAGEYKKRAWKREDGTMKAIDRLAKEEVEIQESHFKIGDEVICKASGMEGEVVKIDPKEEGKYYTVKREDGKMVKYAPDELKLEDEEEDEKDEKEMKEDAIMIPRWNFETGKLEVMEAKRGRPRKNPLPAAAPKQKGDDDEDDDYGPDTGPEADKNLHVQLKKAHDMKDMPKGGADVEFANGKKHFIKAHQAKKVLDAVEKLKPSDRSSLISHMHQSHTNFMGVHNMIN